MHFEPHPHPPPLPHPHKTHQLTLFFFFPPQATAGDLQWTKISQSAIISGTTWATDELIASGFTTSTTIPRDLQAGDYVVRHEIIALHSAYAYPGAQFYPGCHQVKVSGGGSKTPTGLVAFPGAYKASDPGVTYDAYQPQTYTVPGPALFTC